MKLIKHTFQSPINLAVIKTELFDMSKKKKPTICFDYMRENNVPLFKNPSILRILMKAFNFM